MKLRSQVKAATSSGTFWARCGSGSNLRRSRRLDPALQPSSNLYLLPAAEPPSPPLSRKRKAASASSDANSTPPLVVDEKRQRREEDGFVPPSSATDESIVVGMEVEQSDSGRGGEIEDGIKGSESNDVVLKDADESLPHSSISEVSGQGGEIESEKKGSEPNDVVLEDADKSLPHSSISEVSGQGGGIETEKKGSESNDAVVEEADESLPHSSISEVSGQGGEIETEKKGSESNDAVLEEAEETLAHSSIPETEREIPEEERNCCLNRSPGYDDVSISDGESEKIDEEGIAGDVIGSAAVEEEHCSRELPSDPECYELPIKAEEQTEIPSENRTAAAEEEHDEDLPASNSSMELPQLHFTLDPTGDNGRTEREKREVRVWDSEPRIIKRGGGQTWNYRRTEIVVGSKRGLELIQGKVPVVCLYESMDLPADWQ